MALDAREAPVVLTLQERAAGEAIHLQSHHIFTFHKVVRDVEFGRHIGVLTVSHTLSVNPQVEAMPYPIETHENVAAR